MISVFRYHKSKDNEEFSIYTRLELMAKILIDIAIVILAVLSFAEEHRAIQLNDSLNFEQYQSFKGLLRSRDDVEVAEAVVLNNLSKDTILTGPYGFFEIDSIPCIKGQEIILEFVVNGNHYPGYKYTVVSTVQKVYLK